MAVQETRTLPAQFVEDIGTDLAKQLVAQTAIPVVSTGITGISQQPGETADQFAARQKAAEQFQIRQQSLSGLAPQVAAQDPLQQQAQALATQGIGSYQPFLQAAQQYAQQTGLASLLPGLQSQDVSQLGTLGAINQSQSQAVLDAQREAARQATYLPQEQLDRYTGAVTGIMGGYPAAFQSTNVPNPTPLQTALGVGTTLAGIYGSVKSAGASPFQINVPGKTN